ncbi:MAG TPA: NAD(P)/FAD-dependent oxidoreductase, partial [Chromatiaceae bacterium]|nr:NAD(P)/FAD-dependent oxidoreductase [Chromatiaceae bacterium]
KGVKAVDIDRKKRTVTGDDGKTVAYDRLLVATGSTAFVIPLPGHDLPGVIAFRDIADVDSMLETAKTKKNAVVIGGGLLGLEAANGLMEQGMNVKVVHIMDTLMERQLDEPAAKMLQANLEERGLEFLMEAQTESIQGDGKVEKICFKDGSEVEADIVIMAVGIRPNFELAEKVGIHCERGIVVNDTMQTFDPVIYSVGECVQHRGDTYGLVAPLFEMAKVCANHLAKHGIGLYEGTMTSTKLKVTGIDLFSAGDFTGNEATEDLIFKDESRGVYRKLVIKDNIVQGAVMYGDTIDGTWYFDLMRDKTDISDFRSTILFGQAHLGDSGHGDDNRVVAMSDTSEICGCNGVTKGDIVCAIVDKQLFTLDEVRAHTKASSSCGSCTGLVEALIAHKVGGDYSVAPHLKPMCGCTEHTHDEVRAAMREQELKTMPALREAMGWETPDGCPKCRMALNYYLLCQWPTEYEDDSQSRFINERAHANIQHDGTYSVIPRMWGGMTTPQELRAVADVAEKFDVQTVHVTGGQRIGLYGLKKDELP